MPRIGDNDTNAYTDSNAQCHSYTDVRLHAYPTPRPTPTPKTSSNASASPDDRAKGVAR